MIEHGWYLVPHGKAEHLSILKRLLRNAIMEGRLEESKILLSYLGETRVAKTDAFFLLKAKLETIKMEEEITGYEFDSNVLRVLQNFALKFPERKALIMEEITNYYVRHGRVSEAYENLVGHINSNPYCDCRSLVGYSGWLAYQLSARERRPILREKFLRKSIAHFEKYLELVKRSDGVVDFAYFRCFLEAVNIEEVQSILAEFAETDALVKILYIDFLIKELPNERRLIIDQLQLISEKMAIPTPDHFRNHLHHQLSNRQMKIEEFSPILLCYTKFLCKKIENESAEKINHLLFELISLQFQFSLCGMMEDWKRLSGEYPNLMNLLG